MKNAFRVFAGRTEGTHLPDKKKGDPKYQNENSQLAQPIRAKPDLKIQIGLDSVAKFVKRRVRGLRANLGKPRSL